MTRCGFRNLLFGIGAIWVLVGPATASEPPGKQAAALPTDPSPARRPYDEVLKLAPADAWFVAYTASAEKIFSQPLVRELAGARGHMPAFIKTLTETFGGPGVVAISGVPVNPMSWRVTVAARTALEPDQLFERITMKIVPAWNRASIGESVGRLQFVDDGQSGYLSLVGPLPFSLTLTVRDGIIFGSSVPGVAEGWQDGANAADSFVDSDEFTRLSAGRSAPVGTMVYVDTRSLTPLAAMPLNQTLPNLYEALQLDLVESIALITGGPVRPGPLRLAVGIREAKKGVWHLLASTPSKTTLARAFPPETTLFLHGSMTRASNIVEDIKAFAAAIDPEITDEYDRERVEFKRDIGLDPEGEFLANFVQAWAFGADVDTERFDNPMLVFQLASTNAFKTHMHTLRVMYQLENSSMSYRGVTIERAARKPQPFSYAVVGDLLLVSPEQEAVVAGIDAILDQQGLDRTEAYYAVHHRVGSPTSKFVYLDLGEMFARAIESGEDPDIPPDVLAIAKAGTAVGLAVVPHERMIALELVSSDESAEAAIALVWHSIDASLEQARYQAARAMSTANVKGLLTSCLIYAADHKKRWPPSLQVLVQSGVLGDPSQAAKLLANPYDVNRKPAQAPYYLYRYIEEPASVKDPAMEVVISEPEIHHDGAVFGFLDGHAEWIASPRADELMAIMRSGRTKKVSG
ncbi:MAG: DUF3352 domain-containing protein [Phycisphaerae bacterium]